MNIVQRIDNWNHSHPYLLQTILRIILGLVLLQKGISFLSNSEHLRELILQSRFKSWVTFLASYIVFAHLLGGTLIVIGLLTRIVIILQLPILAGAMLFVNPLQGSFSINFELFLSIVVFALLIYFLIKGPGDLSMDTYLKTHLL